MLNRTFYHNSIRRYVSMFGTLFNDIYINREQNDGKKVDTIKVPLSYVAKDRMIARADGDPNTDRKIAIVLPRMGFELVNMVYDPTRKLSKVGMVGRTCDDGIFAYNPTPYNFIFELYINVKNSEDGTKIVEQILPYFTPDWNVKINLIDGMSSKVDIPVILNNISKEDIYEGSFIERRSIVWTLQFTLKGYIMGPVSNRERIEKAITQIFTNWEPGAAPDVRTEVTALNMDQF